MSAQVRQGGAKSIALQRFYLTIYSGAEKYFTDRLIT